MTNVDKPIELIIRLAEKEDRAEVDALRRACCLGPDWDHLSTDNDPSEGSLLVARLTSSGRLVASVRLDLAQTRDQLTRQLGTEVFVSNRKLPDHAAQLLWASGHQIDFDVQRLPTVTVTRACAENTRYDKALRHACIQVVDFMSLNGNPLGSLIGVAPATHPVVQQVVPLGYTVSPAYWGDEFYGLFVAYRLSKPDFAQVVTTLSEAQVNLGDAHKRGTVASYCWEGPWPFERYLPQYMQRRK